MFPRENLTEQCRIVYESNRQSPSPDSRNLNVAKVSILQDINVDDYSFAEVVKRMSTLEDSRLLANDLRTKLVRK